jgi:hypothetical protein
MRTPLLSIRIRHSECPALHAGQQFDTIAEFDATVDAACRTVCSGSQRLAFVLTWKDGATFHGRLDLGPRRSEGLIPHVTSACREVLRDPAHEALVPGAWVTVARLYDAAMAERLARASPPVAKEDCTRTSQTL